MSEKLRSLTEKIKQKYRVSWLKTIYYNFMSGKVQRKNRGILLVYKGTTLVFERDSKVVVEAGKLRLGYGKPAGCKMASLIRLSQGSVIHTVGDVIIEYGADILLRPQAVLSMKKGSYINCHCMIRCHQEISIGEDTITSTELNLRDSDGHSINGERSTAPIIIGDHVWIGMNVTILKGVNIENGAVIGACSLVSHDVPACCLVYGSPARVQREKVDWKY